MPRPRNPSLCLTLRPGEEVVVTTSCGEQVTIAMQGTRKHRLVIGAPSHFEILRSNAVIRTRTPASGAPIPASLAVDRSFRDDDFAPPDQPPESPPDHGDPGDEHPTAGLARAAHAVRSIRAHLEGQRDLTGEERQSLNLTA